MGWYIGVVLLLVIRNATGAAGDFNNINLPENILYEDAHQTVDILDEYEDMKLENLGRILSNLLIQPWPKGVSPILYVENISPEAPEDQLPVDSDNDEAQASGVPYKRSRYYRKYPWKRQNSRYDAENRYLCQPSKEDVFRLLVALHEARQGNKGQMISFCNRKRPASAVFTNIRFLG